MEAKDISSKSVEEKRAIFGASATSPSVTAQSSSTVVDIFQSIKYSVSTNTAWVENEATGEEADRSAFKKAKKSKKSKRERER